MNNSEFFNSEPMDLDFEKTAPKYEGAVAVADETIEKNITNDSVKSTIIREDDTSDLYEKSYLIDLSQVQNLTEQSLESINALLNGGEVAVYIEHSGVRHYVGDGKEEFLFAYYRICCTNSMMMKHNSMFIKMVNIVCLINTM